MSSFTVEGAREAWISMTNLQVKLPTIIQEALTIISKLIINEAKRIVPVDTGRLKDSIKILSVSENAIKGGTEVEYAGFVEFGTSRQRSQPYMRPAVEKAKKEGPKLLVNAIRKML